MIAYEKARNLGDQRWGLWHDLGVIREQRGDMDGALAFFQRALQADEGQADTHLRLAGVLEKRGDGDGALRHYQRTVALDPDNAGAHYGMAQLFIGQGRTEAAREMLKTFSMLKEYEGRLVPLKRAVEQAPRDAQAAFNLARLHVEYGRREKAVPIIRRILELEPGFTAARAELEKLGP